MKTLVVTGASRGIGLEISKQAASEGTQVIALSRNIKPLTGIENVHPFAVDLSDEIAIQGFIEKISTSFTKVDALINNAGSLINKPFLKTSTEDFKKVYEVNVFAVASLIRLIFPMIDPKGHVINISSMGGVQGTAKFPGLSSYSSSKGALIILTELLAEEFKESGPAFNALALGAVQTEMLDEAFPGYKAPISASQMASYILDFAFNGQLLYNGKVLPIASSTP
jgi:NAD(P)-dependent dehydrogenase (short-subunit alcohol dehydrogenase family)|tara:strand:- start:170 stop:844 length:675 start_codon:yes stop_codon:yes gene_type:complete